MDVQGLASSRFQGRRVPSSPGAATIPAQRDFWFCPVLPGQQLRPEPLPKRARPWLFCPGPARFLLPGPRAMPSPEHLATVWGPEYTQPIMLISFRAALSVTSSQRHLVHRPEPHGTRRGGKPGNRADSFVVSFAKFHTNRRLVANYSCLHVALSGCPTCLEGAAIANTFHRGARPWPIPFLQLTPTLFCDGSTHHRIPTYWDKNFHPSICVLLPGGVHTKCHPSYL